MKKKGPLQDTIDPINMEKQNDITSNLEETASGNAKNMGTSGMEISDKISFFSLFRYSSAGDLAFLFSGILCSIFSAFAYPFVDVLYGEFTTLLVDRKMGKEILSPTFMIPLFGGGRAETDGTEEDIRVAIKEDAAAFGIGCGILCLIRMVFSFFSVLLLNYASLRQGSKIRRMFLKSLLRQDMIWYDVNNANFASKITQDLDKIQEGIGERIGLFLYLLLSFLASIAVAFAMGWKLTLIALACSPLIIVTNAVIGKVQTNLSADESKSYGKAGSVAEEVFSSIKTVMSFCGQSKEIERYEKELEESRLAGIRRGCVSGLGGGLFWFITYCSHGVAFWYGVNLILESREANNFDYTPSVLIIVFYGILYGATNMGQAMPHLEAINIARGAASSIFSIIEKKPSIDPLSSEGKTLPNIRGEIKLKNVSFWYPARPEVKVLQQVDLRIGGGEVVALVGSSGSGKSTIVQLLQRLYDPTEGSVLLDGEDIKDLNVGWLRRQIGVVGQEPSLFATTIYENIRHGLETASRQDIENAAKLANAHDFIQKMPQGYDTVLGEKGTQISGGQKQRIAIARALVRNPKILLLDEATSALDAANERAVQAALENASKGRTTVVVTHKLSTVVKADKIIVLSDGRIVEEGIHEELMNLKKHYFTLYRIQGTQCEKTPQCSPKPDTKINSSESSILKEREAPGISIFPVMKKHTKKPDTDKVHPTPLFRIFRYNRPEWIHLAVGSISTLLAGSTFPVVAVIMGELYGVLSEEDEDLIRSTTSKFSVMFLVIGVVAGVFTFFQTYFFNYAGVQLTTRMRIATFSAILRQEAGWFDEENNKTGILCARLSGDASAVQGATGTRISVVLQSFSTLLIGAVMSMFYSWKITLITLISVPIVFLGVFLEAKMIYGQSLLEKQSIERATRVATEAIANIRTVASFGREQYMLTMYSRELRVAEKTMYLKSVMRGLAFAMGQAAPILCYGLSLWYGGILVADEGLHYKNIIKVSEALIIGAWVLGESLAFAPNFTQANMSASRIFEILDRSPKTGNILVHEDKDWKTNGRVALSKVKFSYPTRPQAEVLRNLDMHINQRMSVALVGPSGCGKSTVIQLLQRMYDPTEGSIRLDDHEISHLDMKVLRQQFGLVSQEPVLFDRTIAENIAYGDNSRIVPHCEIVDAAKKANIHDFISCLPLGYSTSLGAGGAQLSGGQKQRIAIARALVRNPRILLLDEATSALDPASESVVQAALDAALDGRTTITVGHRLGAVQRANMIHFIDKGQIVESGTHEELLRLNGRYANMMLQLSQ